MDWWLDEWMNGCMNESINEWMNEWMNEWVTYLSIIQLGYNYTKVIVLHIYPCSKKYIFHNFLTSCAPQPSIVKNYTVFSFRLLWVLNENIQGSDTYEVVNEVLVGSLCLCSKKVFEKRFK